MTGAFESETLSARYSGAGRYVLGGYLAGILIARLGGSGAVTLRAPATVGDRVTFRSDLGLRLLDDAGALLAEATAIGSLDVVPPTVDLEEAADGAARYLGLRGHFFPRCFCCGPHRPVGDGLRIFTGLLEARGIVAAPWTPADALSAGRHDGAVPTEVVCSALDCPAIWALIATTDPASDEKALTGRLEIQITAPVQVGEPYVVVGWPIGADGRKRYAGAAIEREDGSVIALARQTMVVTENGVPLSSSRWPSERG